MTQVLQVGLRSLDAAAHPRAGDSASLSHHKKPVPAGGTMPPTWRTPPGKVPGGRCPGEQGRPACTDRRRGRRARASSRGRLRLMFEDQNTVPCDAEHEGSGSLTSRGSRIVDLQTSRLWRAFPCVAVTNGSALSPGRWGSPGPSPDPSTSPGHRVGTHVSLPFPSFPRVTGHPYGPVRLLCVPSRGDAWAA